MSDSAAKPLIEHLEQIITDYRIVLRLLDAYGPMGIEAMKTTLIGKDDRITDMAQYEQIEADEDALVTVLDEYQWLHTPIRN